MPIRALNVAREGHRMVLRGTSSANTQEKAATKEDLATINYVFRTYWKLNHEMHSQRDCVEI